MTTIDRLIPDIYERLRKQDGWFNEDISRSFGEAVSHRLRSQLGTPEGGRRPTLRLSRMGVQCPKALWHSIHTPELEEKLPAAAIFKYSYGHIIEGLAVSLAKAAGHEVTGEQDELNLDGIIGHRDCVIDGCTVDVKSAASKSFDKFKVGSFVDTFGYLDQLDSYILAAANDPLVYHKRIGYLFLVDKQLGAMKLYRHEVTHEREEILRKRIDYYKRVVAQAEPPPCECRTIPQGASGNLQLDLKASYSSFKYTCFPHLRKFLYAGGPVFLTKVVKRPFNADGPIKEVDKHGHLVYH